jgi:hypothetical protein
MLVGFNTNISYKDKTYHVQTEDSGKNNPVVVTLLYYQGAILASRKTDYSQLLDDPDFKAKVTKLMKIQHKGMIRNLLTGKHTGELKEQEKETEKNKDVAEAKEVREPEQAAKPLELIEIREEQLCKGDNRVEAVTEERRKQLSDSLDDILLTYIMKRAK